MPKHTLRAALPTTVLAALLAAPMPAFADEDVKPAAPNVPATDASQAATKGEGSGSGIGNLEALEKKLEAWIEENQGTITRETYFAKVAELIADVDIESLDAYELDEMKQMIMISPDHRDRAVARATELAKADDSQGAVATILLVEAVQFPNPDEFSTPEEMQAAMQRRRNEAIVKALEHPGLETALREGYGVDIFGMMSSADPEVLSEHADEVIAIAMLIDGDLPPEVLASASSLPVALNEMGDKVTPEQREAIRVRIVDAMRTAMPKAKEKDERLANYLLERNIEFLDSAYARGELIDHASPAVVFAWHSNDPAITSIADLKGKVVVLDFWATGCGPCIASFPNIRKLQQHYDGYDVAIVGVTCLQGAHHSGEGPPIETEGNPEKEYELMKEFMTAKDITWAVAFSESNVFNPDYGVRGIPHVAIVDAAGKVRYNGMHPSSPLAEKTAKIDALLAEAGLATPAPVSPAGDDDESHADDHDDHEGHDHDDHEDHGG